MLINTELSLTKTYHQMGVIDTIEFSDHQVTAWGGMKLMKDMLDACKIKEELLNLPFTKYVQ